MALKAYKHLTDGEVKIVESGSAEETALLADTVKGSSYLQLTSAGHSQEVAAAQGTALWVDVTSDLGGGGSAFEHLTENAGDSQLETDWSLAFSDGVDPADTFLRRYDVGILKTDGDFIAGDSDAGSYVQIFADVFGSGSGAVQVSDGISFAILTRTGLTLASPDGLTSKTITIGNDGTLTLVD